MQRFNKSSVPLIEEDITKRSSTNAFIAKRCSWIKESCNDKVNSMMTLIAARNNTIETVQPMKIPRW